MTTLHDFSATSIAGEDTALSAYAGQVVLVVNTASKCGFTPQYEGLEALYEQYQEQGLVVLGFPCDQFAHQEPGDDAEIEQSCKLNFGVTFPLTTKIDVNGGGTHPIFGFLKGRARGTLTSAVKWNFTKFLVAPDGVTVQRYRPSTEPSALAADIEALLVGVSA